MKLHTRLNLACLGLPLAFAISSCGDGLELAPNLNGPAGVTAGVSATPTPRPTTTPVPTPTPATPTPTPLGATSCTLPSRPDCGNSGCCSEGGTPLFNGQINTAQAELERTRPDIFNSNGSLKLDELEYTDLLAFFTHQQVRQLLGMAAAHEGRFIWGSMLHTLTLLLYCTGVRLGEAVRLHTADVDLDRGMVLIRHSKGRSRLLAIRPDLVSELRRYLTARQQLADEHRRLDTAAFFLRRDASALTIKSASDAIRRLLRDLGMKPPHGRTGARPYEFRHAFAVHRLTAWALAGVDVQAKLPWLSAYLGHQNVVGTEVYLTATPQLLELASSRFEQHLRRSRHAR